MKLWIIFLLILMLSVSLQAQEIDKDLLRIKERMEEVSHFTADIVVDVEAPFINMPPKTASMEYNRGEKIKFKSKDFLIFPKRGLDFTFSELFEHPFISVDRGFKTIDNQNLKVLRKNQQKILFRGNKYLKFRAYGIGKCARFRIFYSISASSIHSSKKR